MENKFSGLKKRALKRKLRKIDLLKNVEIKQLDVYKNVLIISNRRSTFLVEELQKSFPNAQCCHLFLREEKEDKTKDDEFSVHDSDFNLSGKLKNVKLENLLERSFDLVLDLSENSVALSYFVGSVKAELVIGKMSGNNAFHDLRINEGTNEAEFLNNVKSQIALLSTNTNGRKQTKRNGGGDGNSLQSAKRN